MRSDILRIVASRLGNSVIVLFVLSILIFFFMRAIPGDPVLTILGENITSAEQYEALRRELGLHLPLYQQYFNWISLVLQGDFGKSISSQQPVLQIVIEKLKATLELALLAVFIGTVIGMVAGAISAVKRDTWFDSFATIVSLMGISMPVFWLGIILIITFSVQLNLTPTGGMMSFDTMIDPVTGFPLLDAVLTGNWSAVKDLLSHLILPALTLGVTPAALIARTTRASMIEVINEDYVKAGLARGLTYQQVLRRHVLKNAMIPVVTVIGLEIGVYLGGSIVTETVFSWPGLGRQMMDAIYAHDFPIVQGAVLIYAFLIVIVNLLVDITYTVVDPRVKF
jgi:ABC-type dipeptide/oligopeptide/nickel transport system permease component